MAKALLAVRAEVPEADRARFDHWYETDHLPWALRVFEARRAWRCWSRSDPAVHVAFYEFDSVEAAKAATAADKIKPRRLAWGRRAVAKYLNQKLRIETVQEILP